MNESKKLIFFIIGILSLVAGVVGIFLPVLPTTPFLLLSAFLFSKSSPRLHTWIVNHRYLGPPIVDWQKSRVIRPRAKVLASATIILVFSSSIVWADISLPLKWMQVIIGTSVLVFILSRRSHS